MKIAGIILPPPVAEAVRACRPHFVAASVFSLLINLLFLAPAIYMLQVYDRVVATGGTATLFFVTAALAIALLTLSSLDAIRSRLLTRASLKLDAILAPQILRKMASRNSNAALQAMRDFDTVRQAVASPVAGSLFDVPWAPLFLFVAFLLHFWIGILALVSMILLLFVAWRNQRATLEATREATQAMTSSHAAAQSIAHQSDTVRALGMTGFLVERQLRRRSVALGKFASAAFSGSTYAATSRFLRLFVQSAALGLGALLAIAGYISAGSIIAASILLSRALQPVESVIGGWSGLSAARAALQRLVDVFGEGGAERIYTRLPAPDGRIDVEQVGVRGSDGQPILFGVTLDTRPGEMLGIVGPSGSGKTTLAKVLTGAIVPDVGTIRMDGAKYSDWDQDELARHIGFVPQEPSLLEGTVKDNIARFSMPEGEANAVVDAGVISASRDAGVHELILGLPQGYDTPLGPLGRGLSAGQAQRIALARALYGGPAVLILDEPNAFLDGDGETALMQSIEAALARGATVIMIAHRRSVLQKATRLLVLDAGRPKMLGPANEVVARLAPISTGTGR